LKSFLPTGRFDEYYVIYPKPNDLSEVGDGSTSYTLNVETRSFGRIPSKNVVDTLEFIPFDINFVSNLYIEPKSKIDTSTSDLEIDKVKKYGTAVYSVAVSHKVETTGSGLLELGQGYEKGWVSYPKLEHLKVNGWANGFKVNDSGIYYIFFWPQFLEWGGFVILIILSYISYAYRI
jgi:hypothetical protein